MNYDQIAKEEFWEAMASAQRLEEAIENFQVLLAAAKLGQLTNGTAADAQRHFLDNNNKRNVGKSLVRIKKLLDENKISHPRISEATKCRNWVAHDFILEWEMSNDKESLLGRLREARGRLENEIRFWESLAHLLLSISDCK